MGDIIKDSVKTNARLDSNDPVYNKNLLEKKWMIYLNFFNKNVKL